MSASASRFSCALRRISRAEVVDSPRLVFRMPLLRGYLKVLVGFPGACARAARGALPRGDEGVQSYAAVRFRSPFADRPDHDGVVG